MKKLVYIGTLEYYDKLNNSSYGNPKFYLEFYDENYNKWLKGKTADNAQCAYNLPPRNKNVVVIYHITKKGNIIIDNMDWKGKYDL